MESDPLLVKSHVIQEVNCGWGAHGTTQLFREGKCGKNNQSKCGSQHYFYWSSALNFSLLVQEELVQDKHKNTIYAIATVVINAPPITTISLAIDCTYQRPWVEREREREWNEKEWIVRWRDRKNTVREGKKIYNSADIAAVSYTGCVWYYKSNSVRLPCHTTQDYIL